jgi:ABC-type dipeptide/oligopeptide/nickel transport system ATPase subunit
MAKPLFSRFFLTDLHVHTAGDANHRYGDDSGPRDANPLFAERLVAAHAAAGVEIIAVTDHNSVAWWPALREAGRQHGVVVFPGVEINVNRCHLIILWEANKSGYDMAERFVTTLFKPGISPYLNGAPRSVTKSMDVVLEDVRAHHGLVLAPHATARDNGIFGPKVCSNSSELTQGESIAAFDVYGNPGAEVLRNPSSEFQLEPPRWFLSGDVRAWDAVGKRAVWLKLGAQPTLEGLRQAFLAPVTRVRFQEEQRSDWGRVRGIQFASSTSPTWPRLTSLRVEGGFHSQFDVALAPGLNAIIGGKGTGKSALIEIVRYVLALPVPEDEALVGNRARNFRADSDGWIAFVDPSGQPYEVHRSGGTAAPQLISGGQASDLALARRLTVRVFGQRELSELSAGPKLREFVATAAGVIWQEALEAERSLLRDLTANGSLLNAEEEAVVGFDELTAERADLADRIGRAQAAGADAVITQLRALEKADQAVKAGLAWPPRVAAIAGQLRVLAAAPALPTEPAPPADLARTLRDLETAIGTALSTLDAGLQAAEPELDRLQAEWKDSTTVARSELERALAAAGIEKPQELSRWHMRAAELDVALAELPSRQSRLDRLRTDRRASLAKLSAHRRKMSRLVSEAVRDIQATLPPRVRIQVEPLGDRVILQRALERAVARQGVRADQLAHLARLEPDLIVEAIRQGPQAVIDLGVSSATATKLCALGPDDLRRLETTETHDKLELEMELSDGTGGVWRSVAKVSPGQRATASLALALAVGQEPLIIDQPEDDLDNRYIYDEVVKTLAAVCEHRQVIVATHNANIPVLGDAELVIALDADADRSRIVASGGLESSDVAMEARRILEGGDEAFRARQRRYLAAR